MSTLREGIKLAWKTTPWWVKWPMVGAYACIPLMLVNDWLILVGLPLLVPSMIYLFKDPS